MGQTPNLENEGIAKSLEEEVGAGRGDVYTPDASRYRIARDPFRSIRRGRQLFQRKFTMAQGLGPRTDDGIAGDASLGAGLADSCAACHGRPRGAAGFGGEVFTRPDSRDAPHLFGLGLQEMLADEMTHDLRRIRDEAVARALTHKRRVRVSLETKGIRFGRLTVSGERDRRVADVETRFDPERGNLNRLFATAVGRFFEVTDEAALPPLRMPEGKPFVVNDFFADLKRHDLGPAFWERNFDGSLQREFMTEPLWGVGSTAPYGHDGRSINLHEVILRHGGEAERARDRYAAAGGIAQLAVRGFLESLVLFPPDDTASNLNPGDRTAPDFPQRGHGSIRLPALFLDPTDLE